VWGDDPDGVNDTIVLRSTEQNVDGTWSIDAPALRKLTDSEISGSLLKAGDLLLTKSSGSELHIGKASLVNAEVAGLRACYSNFMQRLRVDARTDPRFVHYWLNNTLCREQFAYLSNSTSGLANLSAGLIKCTVLAFPSQSEQVRIANFLDDKTGRIDALIAEKERLVETLNEYEQSTITSAVTKGLNLNAHEVHANEDWLGEIPAHWAQSRVRRVCHRVTDGAHISPDLTSPDFPFVSTVDIAEGTIDFDGCLRASTDCYEYLVKTGCQPKDGDVLFSKDGTIGRTAVVQTGFPDFVVASSLVIVSPCLEKIVPKFLDYWFNNQLLKQYVELQLVGAALRRISVEKVGRLPVLVPPLDEQRAIVRQLDAVTSRIRSLVHHAQEHIARLREYRSSLISAAVTGQLDIGSFKESA
jgi:type I restriction enzyme S subunit